jgi:hypothetical protein
MEKQYIKPASEQMPTIPVRALRNELYRKYKDCEVLWRSLCKVYSNQKYEFIKTQFLRYILIKKKEEPMYLNAINVTAYDILSPCPPCPSNYDPCCDEDDDYNEEDFNEEENDMQDQRNHLSNRVYQIAHEHVTNLRATFHMNDDEAPTTFDELVARFKDGKVQFDKNLKTDRKFSYFPDLTRYITWRDPAVPADEAGFTAANEKVETARKTVMDDVAILDPKDALPLVRAFEAATFN